MTDETTDGEPLEFLSAEMFRTPPKPKRENVKTSRGWVRVLGFDVEQRTRFEQRFQGKDGNPDRGKSRYMRQRLVIATVVDENGKRLLQDGDVAVLSKWPADDFEIIVDKALELSGMSSKKKEPELDTANDSPISSP